ncbi:MAG: hypothetical protein RLN75_01975, partial [Longimicrobiales bacterium]
MDPMGGTDPRDGPVIRAAAVVLRLVLRLQPRWIRDGWNGEIEAAFREGLRARRGTGARLGFALRSIADVVRSAIRERRRGDPLPGAPT